MIIRTFVLISFLTLSIPSAFSQSAMLGSANSMTNQQVWDALLKIDANGDTIFGKCKIADATKCTSCACTYYFRANIPGSLGYLGWPKNPSSGDSTGCMNGCWGGYTAAMCTSDMKANAKAMLLHAINNNACGTPVPPVKKGGVTILDTSKFFFVDPAATCSQGKIQCGVVGLGSEVNGMVQFTKLPEHICTAAYGVAQKAKTNRAKMITCKQLSENQISNAAIQQAASMVGQLNQSYDKFALAGLQKYLDYDDNQLNAMTTSEVALYYVAVDKNSNKLPQVLKPRVLPEKFDVPRGSSDNYIVTSEITAAEAQLNNIAKGVVVGKNFTLAQALQHLQQNGSASNSKQ